MAALMQCDKCKDMFDAELNMTTEVVIIGKPYPSDDEKYDLCSTCLVKVKELLLNYTKPEEVENGNSDNM